MHTLHTLSYPLAECHTKPPNPTNRRTEPMKGTPIEVTGPVRRPYVTDTPPWRLDPAPDRPRRRREQPAAERRCVVCDLGGARSCCPTCGAQTCLKATSRHWYEHLASHAGAVLPGAPEPEPAACAPEMLVCIPSLAELAARVEVAA